jgi:hypothetical protein
MAWMYNNGLKHCEKPMPCLAATIFARVQKLQHILQALFVLLLASCANVMAPTGGPSDTTPPTIASRSLADSARNFKGGKIQFDFDEKIVANKVVVSSTPFLKGKPNVRATKRGFEVELDDTMLEPNTTYRISFGNTITDINEGNAMQDVSFCFSTGESLDSLTLSGEVLQAQNAKPDTSAWVCLYTNITSDSDIVRNKPMYAIKVDGGGKFVFKNLPNREFYLYTIGDKNFNYLLDMATERIGFLPSTVLPTTNLKSPIVIRSISQVPDSAKAAIGARAKERININVDTADIKKRTFDITQNLEIVFKQPLKYIDLSKIRLFGADGLLDETGIVQYDSAANMVRMNFDWIQDTVYQLQLLDSFAVDTSKIKGAKFSFRTKKQSDFGSLQVNINDSSTTNKILVLYQGDKKVNSIAVRNNVVKFPMLNPGNYQLVLIHDTNGNDVWDNGSYFGGKQQAEYVERRKTDIVIKANWDNVVKFRE